MEPRPLDPWREFADLQRRFNEILDEFFQGEQMRALALRPSLSPAVDVYESAGALVVRAALPGVLEEDIDVTFEESCLVIRGNADPPLDVLEERYLLKEWRYGCFERRLELPAGYDASRATTEYYAGALEIRIPRA